MVRLILALLLLCSAIAGARAQAPAPAAPAPSGSGQGASAQGASAQSASSLSAAEAQKALAVLKDPAKLAELVTVLEAMAKAAPAPAAAAAPAPVLPLAPDSVGAQVLMDSSRRIAALTDDLVSAVQAVTDFPLLWRFAEQLVTDPFSRGMVLSTAWRLAVVFAAGLAAHWLLRRALARPRAALAAWAATRRASEAEAGTRQALDAAEAGETEPSRQPVAVLTILRRVPGVLGRLALQLLPVLAFLAVGFALLGVGLGTDVTARLVILGLMNAYAICRLATALLRSLIGPGEPRLFLVSEEAAQYGQRWMRRIVAVAVFGYAAAEIGLLFGLYRIAHDALLKLVALAVHVMLIVMVLQNRARVAAWLRGGESDGMFGAVRRRVAAVWHLIAAFYLFALWAVWALNVPDGFSRLLRVVVVTVAVLAVGRFLQTRLTRLMARWTKVPASLAERYPELDTRLGSYDPVARFMLGSLVWAGTFVALFQAWGFDAVGWFGSGRLGGRVASALATIAITVVVALAAWELANLAIAQHLARLAREAQLARSARLRTLLPMARTALMISLGLVAGLSVLSEIGVNIAPLLAGAGVVGLAIGFGSQKLVQDIITGLFLLLENAMQVGDAVTLAGMSGGVEALSVRTIRLRSGDGSVHIIPFSAVTTVTNMTRDFGFAMIDVTVGVNEDPDRIMAIVREIANGMRQDEEWSAVILDDVEIWGVEKFSGPTWLMQGRIKTTASSRWGVRRELNRRIKHRFDALGIDSPLTSWEARKQTPPTVVGFLEPG